MQNDIDNVYLKKSVAASVMNLQRLPIVQLSNLIPFLSPLLEYVFLGHLMAIGALSKLIPSLKNYVEEMPRYWLINRIREVIDVRTKSSSSLEKRVDLLQLMIDSSTLNKVKVSLYGSFTRVCIGVFCSI